MNATTKHLHALPFWDHLSDAEKDILCNNAYIRSFDRDSYILHSKAGEDIGLMMLIEGSVRAYLLSPDGRETTLFSLHDQSICIFSALSLFNQISFQVFLASDCCSKVLVVNMSIMKQLMQNNLYFRCFAYELIAERFNLVMGSMQRILFNSLEQRLAAFLVAEYNRCGKTHIQLTHNYIARYIGTSRERVTKTLKKLNEKNCLTDQRDVLNLRILTACAPLPRHPAFRQTALTFDRKKHTELSSEQSHRFICFSDRPHRIPAQCGQLFLFSSQLQLRITLSSRCC